MVLATASAPAGSPAPVLVPRLLSAPRYEPPYDDERADAPPFEGSLALAPTLPLPIPLPQLPSDPPRPLRVVRPVPDATDDGGRVPTPRAELPAPGPVAARLARGLVEVLSGERPAAHVTTLVSEDVLAELERRVSRLAAAGPPGVRRALREVIRSVHVSEPADGVAEVCAVVRRGAGEGARHRAIALRMEGLDGSWCCTALEVG